MVLVFLGQLAEVWIHLQIPPKHSMHTLTNIPKTYIAGIIAIPHAKFAEGR